MSLKAGELLHYGNGFLLDRLQTAGPGNLGIPEEKIYELGNYESVATIRDTPDLTWDGESFDMSTEFEAVLLGLDPTTVVAGDEFNFNASKPIDIANPFKAGGGFTTVRGIAIPYLVLDSLTYRFGVRQNAQQNFTLRGDSIYYIPGTPYVEDFSGAGGSTLNFANPPAIITREAGEEIYAYCVTVFHADGTYTRLYHGDDFTDSTTGVTLLDAPAGTDVIRVVYGSATGMAVPQSIHPLHTEKPAAVRHPYVDVYVSDGAATPSLVRVTGAQSAEVSRRVTIEKEEELGNVHAVSQDYDVPDVSGNIVIRPRDVDTLFNFIHQITGVPANETINALNEVALELEVRVKHPDTGATLKTLYVDDAKFQPPPVQGRAGQNSRTEVTVPWTSEGGSLLVYAGDRP